MRVDAFKLLRRLEPVVRPCGLSSVVANPSIATAAFDELLASAQRGELASGRQVDDSMLDTPIDPYVTERLGRIADAAEVAGFARVLVATDDRSLVLDVANRFLEGELTSTSGESFHRVDAAVRVLGETELAAAHVPAQFNNQPPAAICEAILTPALSNESSPPIRDEHAA